MAKFGSGKLSTVELKAAFAVLEQCVLRGERCPITSGPNARRDITALQIQTLAQRKWIAVEVSGHNWRVVKLLIGKHAGKSSAPNPNANARVYRTINGDDTRVNGRIVA